MGSDNRSSRPKGRRSGALGALLELLARGGSPITREGNSATGGQTERRSAGAGWQRSAQLVPSRSTFFLLMIVLLPGTLLLTSYSLTNSLPTTKHPRALAVGGEHASHRSPSKAAHHAKEKDAKHVHHVPSPKPQEDTGGCVGAECPKVTGVWPTHGRATGGLTVTITGTNLGTAETLEGVSVGENGCVSFASVSPTQVTCVVPKGTGVSRPISVVKRSSSGIFLTSFSHKAAFSYDPPVVVAVDPPHGPRIGGSTVMVRGSNFGETQSFPIAFVGSVPCQTTTWVSDTAVACVVPAGQGVNLPVQVTVCGCGPAVSLAQTSAVEEEGGPVFAYDEDMMRQAAAGVCHKLPIKPAHLELIMNKKHLGATDYEVRYTDPVGGAQHFYAVPPTLYGVLPNDDFRPRYETCAVVGNSGGMRGTLLGGTIDEADAVFRFHNAPTQHFETHIGSKTTFMVLDHYWMETLMVPNEDNRVEFTTARWWNEEANLLVWSKFDQEAYIQIRNLHPTNPVLFLSQQLLTLTNHLAHAMKGRIEEAMKTRFTAASEQSSMLYAVMFASRVCGSVKVYGMDFRTGSYHYFDDYDPGDHSRSRHNMEYYMLRALEAQGYLAHVAENAKPRTETAEEEGAEGMEPPEGTHTKPPPRSGELIGMCEARECENDCGGRGQWRNGSCACEPVYAGSDCSIDLMQRSAATLLEGLDTRYQGPITMHKGEVNGTGMTGGFIKLPKGVTHQKLREGDTYRVDRLVYSYLPEHDMAERYGTCAIVGNSGSMLKHEYGRYVDSHDLVYRFNQAPVKGFERYVGSRASFESLNGFWVKELVNDKRGYRWNWRSQDTALVLFEMFEPWAFIWKTKTQIIEKDKWWKATYVKLRKSYPQRKIVALSPQFVSWTYLLYRVRTTTGRELRRRFQRLRLGHYPGEKPMSGFYAFFYALQVCEQVDIYGFAPWKEAAPGEEPAKYHYFDDAIPRPGSHSFDLATYIYQLLAYQYDNVRIHS